MMGSYSSAVRAAFPDLGVRLSRKRARARYMLFLFLARQPAGPTQ